jgi:hypothetical protein
MAREIILDWLRTECACDAAYLGVRYPTPFVAVLSEILSSVLNGEDLELEHGPAIEEFQMYSVWLRYGFTDAPNKEVITQAWDTVDHFALETSRSDGCAQRRAQPSVVVEDTRRTYGVIG